MRECGIMPAEGRYTLCVFQKDRTLCFKRRLKLPQIKPVLSGSSKYPSFFLSLFTLLVSNNTLLKCWFLFEPLFNISKPECSLNGKAPCIFRAPDSFCYISLFRYSRTFFLTPICYSSRNRRKKRKRSRFPNCVKPVFSKSLVRLRYTINTNKRFLMYAPKCANMHRSHKTVLSFFPSYYKAKLQ